MFIPFSLLFFLATTSLPLTRIGLGLSIAAVVRIPATVAAGPLSDRFGPRAAIVGSQLLQAAGFAGYLFVHGFLSLVTAAVLVQVGNSIFWVAYAPLIFTVAPDGEREHWFALGTALRTAGWAAGGVIAGATVAAGGRDGYIVVAAANGASFVLAALLSARLRPGMAAPRQGAGPGAGPGRSSGPGGSSGPGESWQPLLRDRAFLGFVAVNVGVTFVALAVPTALPVFLVKVLGLPAWSPGAALALNATLVAVSTPVMMSAIAGRRRRNVLMASQASVIVALAVFLLVHLLPAGAAVTLVLIAIVPLAACEVMQGAVVPAVVTESAAPLTLGRYTSAYQVTFSIADIICPAVVTVALHAGAAALWLPLSAVALLDLAAVGLLARGMSALTQRVGQTIRHGASLVIVWFLDGLWLWDDVRRERSGITGLSDLGPYARTKDSLAREERGDRLPPDDPGRPGRLPGTDCRRQDAVETGLGRAELEQAFAALGDRLLRRGIVADVFIVGGAAMALAYDATRDVDALFKPHGIVHEEAMRVADDLGLPRWWLNEQASTYISGKDDPDKRRVFDHPGLRVMAASPRHIFAMKALAARTTWLVAGPAACARARRMSSAPPRPSGMGCLSRLGGLLPDLSTG